MASSMPISGRAALCLPSLSCGPSSNTIASEPVTEAMRPTSCEERSFIVPDIMIAIVSPRSVLNSGRKSAAEHDIPALGERNLGGRRQDHGCVRALALAADDDKLAAVQLDKGL